MITKKIIDEMKDTDVRTVDPDTLVDLDNVHIKEELPLKERIEDYIEQIKNPYCYKSHGMIVKIGFAEKSKLEDCLKVALFPNVEM